MSPRKRRLSALVTTLALAASIVGCGKSNPQTTPQSPRPVRHAEAALPKLSAPLQIPLKLTAERAARFANAVNLKLVDVTGASVTSRSSDPEEERETGKCGASASIPIGGGRSSKLDRGAGLEHESISSSVVVLSSAAMARADFLYASSRAGLRCYGKILRKSLESDATPGVDLGRVQLRRMQLPGPGAVHSLGIRISAQVSSPTSRLSVPLYIDAVGFLYGPVEIDLYATSFVQPEPRRTEQELLSLMAQRALLQRL